MSFAAVKSETCAAVASELGYAPGSARDRAAQTACEVAKGLGRPAAAAFGFPMGWNAKQIERAKRRERKAFERDVHARTVAAIRANPNAYGFTGIELLFLGWIVSGIVAAIARYLFDRWWGGKL